MPATRARANLYFIAVFTKKKLEPIYISHYFHINKSAAFFVKQRQGLFQRPGKKKLNIYINNQSL